ncbi:MAG: hypothetical protein V2A64_01820 [Candidatus Omnitrophota bacterium]
MPVIANLKKICACPLNLKILLFFQENPSTVDTANSLAAWINVSRDEIEKALEYLVAKGILIQHYIRGTKAYAYTQDKKSINQIEKFLKTRKEGEADV